VGLSFVLHKALSAWDWPENARGAGLPGVGLLSIVRVRYVRSPATDSTTTRTGPRHPRQALPPPTRAPRRSTVEVFPRLPRQSAPWNRFCRGQWLMGRISSTGHGTSFSKPQKPPPVVYGVMASPLENQNWNRFGSCTFPDIAADNLTAEHLSPIRQHEGWVVGEIRTPQALRRERGVAVGFQLNDGSASIPFAAAASDEFIQLAATQKLDATPFPPGMGLAPNPFGTVGSGPIRNETIRETRRRRETRPRGSTIPARSRSLYPLAGLSDEKKKSAIAYTSSPHQRGCGILAGSRSGSSRGDGFGRPSP